MAKGGIMRYKFLVLAVLFLVGCTEARYCGFKQSELEESFIPLPGYISRAPVACDHVVYMESVPTNRVFREVGLIAPRTAKQKSWGDAVHAALAAAAFKGADATYPISEKEMETWGFSAGRGGAFGGKKHYVNLRMKAIVWSDEPNQ
jgi:hypothetical protein